MAITIIQGRSFCVKASGPALDPHVEQAVAQWARKFLPENWGEQISSGVTVEVRFEKSHLGWGK